MSELAGFQLALDLQDEIIKEQRVAGRGVDALGRPVMPCCGAPILTGRVYQCVHDHEEKRVTEAEQMP